MLSLVLSLSDMLSHGPALGDMLQWAMFLGYSLMFCLNRTFWEYETTSRIKGIYLKAARHAFNVSTEGAKMVETL